ncbi:hypothetical protein NU219Hw_g6400t1 [Hortaea werneckii]
MAATHAGVKRSYEGLARPSPTPTSSREASPLRQPPNNVSGTPVLRSGFETPLQDWTELPRKASFDSDASVVLVGVRGVGKSSLGILAATAYSRRLIESERAFHEATGVTTQAFRKLHGATKYHQEHHKVLSQVLKVHSKHAVIVCSFSDLEANGAQLLRQYAQAHPVIHVTRDAKGVQSHLQVWSLDRVRQLLRASGPLLRSCTNFEFFNLSERIAEVSDQGVQDLAKLHNGLFLTLKRVERDFLKMLRNIVGDQDREQSHHSAYPLSQVPVHTRDFTLSAVVDAEDIITGTVDLDELQIGVDAIEVDLAFGSDLASAPNCAGSMEDDLLKAAEAFSMMRRSTILPIIVGITGRGSQLDDAETKAKLASYCLRLAPEYCNIDLSLEDKQLMSLMSAKGRTRVIGNALMEERPAEGWQDDTCSSKYRHAVSIGCDLVKVTMPAERKEDNFAVETFRSVCESTHPGTRLIAYNTGKPGRFSMCFNRTLTPVRSLRSQQTVGTQEWQCPSLKARDVFASLFASFVYEPMHFFIYGANVSYSLSPAMHNAAYQACGMPHTYGTHSSPDLEDFKRLSRDHHFGGAAVVQPYKTLVVPLIAGMSSHAKAIGSVNTIVPIREYTKQGSVPDEQELLGQANRSGEVLALYGHNTDWIGIRACLRRGLSPANTVRPQTTALVCGAGGQARSSIYAMLSLGVRNIFVCNRTKANAEVLANHYNELIASSAISELDTCHTEQTRVRVLDSFGAEWPKEYRQPSLIVSTIPAQAADGTLTNFTIPDDWLKSPTGGVLIELAYRPMLTPIVLQMRAQAHKGWIFMDGFDILPEQAFAQFELFTGRRAPRKLMRDEVITRYREEQSQHGISASNRDPNPSSR